MAGRADGMALFVLTTSMLSSAFSKMHYSKRHYNMQLLQQTADGTGRFLHG